MDIIISDNWLREFLITPAKPKQIAEYVSLCGPSIENIEERNGDSLYHIEITTNRIDSVSVYGFAREVAAILPRFKIPAKLKPLSPTKNIKANDDLPFKIVSNNKLVRRAMGVVLTNIKNWETPSWMEKRLILSGVRSLNAVVDITNYVMLEVGHPSHAFDYDKINNKKFVIRESEKGERITSFDGKTYTLLGGDIVFDDGEGDIIDLPGIIGTKNSVVDENTKRVFFFIDNNDPTRIRNTSMGLAIRTMAASINEKGVDPELGETAIYRGIELFKQICKAEVASKLFDVYPSPYKQKTIQIEKGFIDKSLGIFITKDEIEKYLAALQFEPKWTKDTLLVTVPSFRADDINIPEDFIEEIARIYGYHNLPSKLMAGELPNPLYKTSFSIESKIKNTLKALGGSEVYTLSLVPMDFVKQNALKLINALGKDTEYLRTNLRPCLIKAAQENKGEKDPFHLFEMANIYSPTKGDLPDEIMSLAGIFSNYTFREVRGVIESFLHELNINASFIPEDSEGFQASRRVSIKCGGNYLGELGIGEESELTYYKFDTKSLEKFYRPYPSYRPVPKYPPQIEDITLILPEKTRVGDIVTFIKLSNKLISAIELRDIFKDAYTFRVEFLNPLKTLSDSDVEIIRNNILRKLKERFGVIQKN